jgi:DNA-binding MarR family transcriptional regulator
MVRSRGADGAPGEGQTVGLGFLLSQVGAHAAARFADCIAPLKLAPPHVGILNAVAGADGLSQQALCDKLGIFPSRLVGLLDELEERKLVERRNSPSDRRSYALYVTRAGRAALKEIETLARANQESLCAALNAAERAQLASLLQRIADQQQLTPGIHPGYKRMGGGPA